jgi:D-alanyl-D-alanine carboxypeptidase
MGCRASSREVPPGVEDAGERPKAFYYGVKIRQRNVWALPRFRAGIVLALSLAMVLVGASEGALARSKKSRSGGSSIAASIVVDMNSGRVLQSRSPDVARYPASLTKMMTLYMLFTYMRASVITPDSELLVTPYAASQPPTKLNLKPGSTIRTRDAIGALVTLSANDVAVTIAENLAGTEGNFARMMTKKAQSIGMMSTVFRNASGLPNDEQVTTARDMAILATRLIRDFPEYYDCFQTKYFSYNGRRYRNHNHLLFNYKGTDGIKTGYTRAAGFNLTASVQRGDKHLVAVVLGGRTSAQRDAAMRGLLDQTFPKAVAAKAAAPYVASLDVAALPKPTPKKQVFALASAGPSAETIRFGGQTVVPGVAPVTPVTQTAATTAEGDADASDATGPFHVQVGAYTSQAEANSRLGEVQGKAANLLDGHPPLSMMFQKDDTQWYRARFAGFSQDDARSTCAELKRMSLDCIVMRAN